MSKGAAIDLGLNEAYNDLFSTQEERDNAQRSYVTDLTAAEISDFPNHPFKVRMDQSMVELADSVKQYGVLVPSLVRPMPNGSYQMVSGHRRKRAAELAGLPGAFCATLGVVLPSFLIILLVARFYAAFRSSAIVSGAMGGLRPAVIGMIGAAVVSVGQTVFLPEGLAAVTAYPLVCSLTIFVLMAVLTYKKLHPIVIILLSALLGIVTGYLQPA